MTVAALADGGRLAPPPLTPERARGTEARGPGGRAGSLSAATIRNGSSPSSSAPSAPMRRRRGRRWPRRAPVDLRVNTLKADARQGAEGAPPLRCRAHAAFAASASASRRRRARAAARMSRPSPATAKAGTRCRTKARRSRRCSPARSPSSRSSTSAPAPAARRWGSRPLMENTGQLYAYDADRMRLRPIFERLKRAGVRNVQVLAGRRPRGARQARRQDGPAC